MRYAVEHAPVSRNVVKRFVAGETAGDAIRVSSELVTDGLAVSLDHLGEDTISAEDAEAATASYIELLGVLAEAGLTDRVEVSVKLSALGGVLDHALAVDQARRICSAATLSGTTVTLDMEDHTATDATLDAVRELRADFPWVGAVVQAYLRRTEADCRDLAIAGSRVRLCKGAYDEPASVAFVDGDEVDASYRRCLELLMRGPGYPMVATHDPALIGEATRLIAETGRTPDSYEHQMLYGVRPAEQKRLAASGATMRVYVPYGPDWYGYLMRRMAERPANLRFFLRALATQR